MAAGDLAFPENEYQIRLKKIQERMVYRHLHLLLLHSMSNICYVTGYESLYLPKYYMVLVPLYGDPILFCQDFEMHNADITSWVTDRVPYALDRDPIDGTISLIKKLGFERANIGVEMNSQFLPAGTFGRLTAGLPAAGWFDASEIVDSIRLIKSPAEIDYIRHAANISSQAMTAALDLAGEGRSDQDLAAVASQTAFAAGSEYMCISPIITVGRRSGIPHTTHRRTRIEKGDSVFMELGACIRRYTGVTMRTAFIGDPPAKVRGMADGCIRSVEAMIETIKPGRPASEVALKAKAALGPIGEECLWHGYYGYSIGLGFPHDWSDVDFCIREENHLPLRSGMVFHCSTSLRDIGKIGVTASETILVTDHGCEVLTDVARKLFIK